MTKLRILALSLFSAFALDAQAQQGIASIDKCLSSEAVLDTQISACDAALQSSEATDAELAYLPAIIAELRGETGDFEAAFQATNATDASGAELLLAMAEAQYQANRLELAMMFFELALYHFPNNVSAQEVGTQFLDDMRGTFGDDDTGFVELLSVGLRVSPRDPVLRNERAMLYVAQGDIESALIDWDIAIESAIYPYLFRFRRAEGLWAFERGDEALDELKPLTVDLLPGGSYETELSSNLSGSNVYPEEEQLKTFQQIGLIRASVYLLQVQIYVAWSDWNAALRIANEWIDVDIGQGQPLFERAKILNAVGRDVDALNDLDDAVRLALQHEGGEIGRLSRFAILNRAGFHMQRDEFDLAMPDFDRVFETDAPDVVQKLQEHLASSELFDGEINGLYGPETRRAFLTCLRAGLCDP